jgi:acyl-coenzyme A thioesterase PaaI-like protein
VEHATKLRWIVNLWPPNLAAGIRVLEIAPDYRRVRVRLKRYFFNRNYVGTHFGGSLFAMTDPWWMIMLIRNLGSDYVVWDKAATIDFVKAVREPVFAEFVLEPTALAALRAEADRDGKTLQWFEIAVRTAEGTVVAQVRKQVYVRRRREGSEAVTEREPPAAR